MASSDPVVIVVFGNGVNVAPSITNSTVAGVNAMLAAGTLNGAHVVPVAGMSNVDPVGGASETRILLLKGVDAVLTATGYEIS